MRFSRTAISAATAALFFASMSNDDAHAQGFTSTTYENMDGWLVQEVRSDGNFAYCAAETAVRGFGLRIGYDGQVWTIGADAGLNEAAGSIDIDGFREPARFLDAGDGWIFALPDAETTDRLRSGRVLTVEIQGGSVAFSLAGSFDAMRSTAECAAAANAAATAPPPRTAGGWGAPAPCADGLPRVAALGICRSDAYALLRTAPNWIAEAPPGCSWTINATPMPGGEYALYNAAECNGEVGVLEFSGGARFAELKSDGTGDMAAGVAITVASAEPFNPAGTVEGHARAAMENKALANQCYAQPGATAGYPSDSFIVDQSPAKMRAAIMEGPYAGFCGRFGQADYTAYWRVLKNNAFFFDLGQDAFADIDPGSLTIIRQTNTGGTPQFVTVE